jgi:FtsP/CotA-like multicopper oxidase with cupredoxin domain
MHTVFRFLAPLRRVPSRHRHHLVTTGDRSSGAAAAGAMVDYRVGDWRDTISLPTPGNVTIRFRPTNYTGLSVAHCHLITHEDQGMMMAIDIRRAQPYVQVNGPLELS